MIDRTELSIKGGNGGDGSISFRREKFVPFGGPDGGDGGDGGSVFLVAVQALSTLSHLRYRKRYQAGRGGHGRGKNQHGRKGRDLLVEVPLGTSVYVEGNGEQRFLADLTLEGQRVLVAKGGKGGWGNAHFVTATNQAPRTAQRGEPGAEYHLVLDLKLIADVGIIGEPNVGKSTLLSSISKARPKIADYPFTTTEPILGVVELGYQAFVLAEIPGLIEGAHRGLGLGYHFLRHIERTKVLIHLLDGGADNPLSHIDGINKELMLFNPALGRKPQLIAVNKIDLPSVRARIPELREELEGMGFPFCFISAATGEGLAGLMATTVALLQRSQPQAQAEETQFKIFRPKPVR
jgi:GTP-binding protein